MDTAAATAFSGVVPTVVVAAAGVADSKPPLLELDVFGLLGFFFGWLLLVVVADLCWISSTTSKSSTSSPGVAGVFLALLLLWLRFLLLRLVVAMVVVRGGVVGTGWDLVLLLVCLGMMDDLKTNVSLLLLFAISFRDDDEDADDARTLESPSARNRGGSGCATTTCFGGGMLLLLFLVILMLLFKVGAAAATVDIKLQVAKEPDKEDVEEDAPEEE